METLSCRRCTKLLPPPSGLMLNWAADISDSLGVRGLGADGRGGGVRGGDLMRFSA